MDTPKIDPRIRSHKVRLPFEIIILVISVIVVLVCIALMLFNKDLGQRVHDNYEQIKGFLESLWTVLGTSWARGAIDNFADKVKGFVSGGQQ
jgi:hypothetical protein